MCGRDAVVVVLVALAVVPATTEVNAQTWVADPSGAFSVPGPSPRPDPYNTPSVYQQGQGSYYWCSNCGRYHYRQGDSHTTYQSALDPNRGYVDPGSMRYQTRWVWTPQGWAQQQTQSWTSFGVYHDNGLRINPDGSAQGWAHGPRPTR